MTFRPQQDDIRRLLETAPMVKTPKQADRKESDYLESLFDCWSECTVVHLAVSWRATRYLKCMEPPFSTWQAIRDFDIIRRQVCAN